jgi:hypothetical protein
VTCADVRQWTCGYAEQRTLNPQLQQRWSAAFLPQLSLEVRDAKPGVAPYGAQAGRLACTSDAPDGQTSGNVPMHRIARYQHKLSTRPGNDGNEPAITGQTTKPR